jgi:hypothetical protein
MSYACRDLVGFITLADLRQAAATCPGSSPCSWIPTTTSPVPTLVLAGEYDAGVPPLIVRQRPSVARLRRGAVSDSARPDLIPIG